MSKNFLDNNGLAYFWTYLKTFFVPQTRTVNNKPLSSDITLTTRDINAITDPQIKEDGQILCWDATNQAWKAINFEPGGVQSIEEGTVNGTIRVNGVQNVFVHGLKSAAYREVGDFRSSQWVPSPSEIGAIEDPGDKSDGQLLAYDATNQTWKAINKELPNNANDGDVLKFAIDGQEGYWIAEPEQQITESDVNGNIAVGSRNVPVHGLGSSAFTNTNAFVAAASVGSASGVCPLDAASKVDPTFLPSYVDDVIECYIVGDTPLAAGWLSLTVGGDPLTPEQGKIYIILTAGDYENFQYRWGGSAYVKINDSGVSSMTNAEIDEILNS